MWILRKTFFALEVAFWTQKRSKFVMVHARALICVIFHLPFLEGFSCTQLNHSALVSFSNWTAYGQQQKFWKRCKKFWMSFSNRDVAQFLNNKARLWAVTHDRIKYCNWSSILIKSTERWIFLWNIKQKRYQFWL